jgi:hypothetical protein
MSSYDESCASVSCCFFEAGVAGRGISINIALQVLPLGVGAWKFEFLKRWVEDLCGGRQLSSPKDKEWTRGGEKVKCDSVQMSE